jgi:hypothetical protein
MDAVNFFKAIVFTLSLYPLQYSLRSFLKGKINAAVILYPIFFVFYSIHLLLDVIYGVPIYQKKFHSFYLATQNLETVIIYLLYVVSVIGVFTYFQKKRKYILVERRKRQSLVVLVIKSFFLFFAIYLSLYFISSPNPLDYLVYGDIRTVTNPAAKLYYGKVAFFSMISGFIILVLRASDGSRCSQRKRIVYVFILLLDIYLNNKRLVFSFIPLYYLLEVFFSDKKKIPTLKFAISMVLMVIAYYSYAHFIKLSTKVVDNDLIYFYLRHELGRDDTMQFAIFQTIVNGRDIMEYHGQSFISTILNYYPRDFYSNKPYPYSQYFTNNLLYGRVGAGLLGWSVTTSILDEFVSNFHILGLPLSLLFIAYFIKYIDKQPKINTKLFFMFLFILLIMLHTSPYALLVYIAGWIIIKKAFKNSMLSLIPKKVKE